MSKSKSLSRFFTELFPIYQNKNWSNRQQDNQSVDPSSHCIILKIVGFYLSEMAFINQFYFVIDNIELYEPPFYFNNIGNYS